MLSEVSLDFVMGGALATLALLIFFHVSAMARRRWARSRLRRRSRWAFRAEEMAEGVLRRAGFKVIGDQVEGDWRVLVDGEEVMLRLVADWLVERRGARYLVEVKTGTSAPSIRNAATRRQLLEYLCAFEVEGVILLDMEEEQLRVVEFPDL